MIIGSGLLAQAFANAFSHRDDVCIYAAGVSNSSCIEGQEFLREQQCLVAALQQAKYANVFVYFGTCSATDSTMQSTAYIQHKLAMEQLVSAHPRYLILRLPQIAGKTPNPHTLLNFLYTRISRSEGFKLWSKAKRNIIDVDDVAKLAYILIEDHSMRSLTLNIANTLNYSMVEIITEMERAVGKSAIYEVVERGSEYSIDISAILPLLTKTQIEFDNSYLNRVICKYYDYNF